MTKGELVRLFLSNSNTTSPTTVIAAAQQLQLHVSIQLEEVTTKDTVSDWVVQEAVGISYDITSSALVRSGEEITSSIGGQSLNDIENIYTSSEPVKWEIANVSGANNRTKGVSIVQGSGTISQLTINAQNKSVATYTIQLTGYGAYVVGT